LGSAPEGIESRPSNTSQGNSIFRVVNASSWQPPEQFRKHTHVTLKLNHQVITGPSTQETMLVVPSYFPTRGNSVFIVNFTVGVI
jgi:hypothetical protein